VQGKERGEKKKGVDKEGSLLSNTYTNKVDKKRTTPYLLKQKDGKVIAHKVNKQDTRK
jgi:hypothetical protein